MCRNIRKLRRPEGPPTEAEIRLASLQFIRKVSGYPKPSERNREAFELGVEEVSAAVARMFARLGAPRQAA